MDIWTWLNLCATKVTEMLSPVTSFKVLTIFNAMILTYLRLDLKPIHRIFIPPSEGLYSICAQKIAILLFTFFSEIMYKVLHGFQL